MYPLLYPIYPTKSFCLFVCFHFGSLLNLSFLHNMPVLFKVNFTWNWYISSEDYPNNNRTVLEITFRIPMILSFLMLLVLYRLKDTSIGSAMQE